MGKCVLIGNRIAVEHVRSIEEVGGANRIKDVIGLNRCDDLVGQGSVELGNRTAKSGES